MFKFMVQLQLIALTFVIDFFVVSCKRVIQKIIPLNRKNYPPRTRFRCRNCTCNCGRRHNFFEKKLSLLQREEKMHAWTKQCRISDENAHLIFFFNVVFQKLLFIYFCRSRLVTKTHQRYPFVSSGKFEKPTSSGLDYEIVASVDVVFRKLLFLAKQTG